ncbi:MAG TPA: GTPase domain-containing protein [Caldisericia bacterium]|nr:GTPase domain-containing protein [Caldisericia bacterium]HPB33717.1 GTPase domain-containing protein [Caldisericia bacterium]HQL66523.1 GTPase domain-containing protein [Caldisericia bacterium]HQN48051.1 GTPase domain-containing protein [Caldisericia bacterium]HQP00008.1 GTPase domain-containing protein [Caldisericia bacterium]
MALINYSAKEITFKIVYYGPAMSGKTTNLRFIYDRLPEELKGKFTSIATQDERTLFFDFLPLDLGTIKGFSIKLSLYTVPGQAIYSLTRKTILRATDGIIFVADSQKQIFEKNIESLKDMIENMKEYGLNLENTPIILQYNKRDLNDIVSVEDLNNSLNFNSFPYLEAVAIQGIGVMEALKLISKLVVRKIT